MESPLIFAYPHVEEGEEYGEGEEYRGGEGEGGVGGSIVIEFGGIGDEPVTFPGDNLDHPSEDFLLMLKKFVEEPKKYTLCYYYVNKEGNKISPHQRPVKEALDIKRESNGLMCEQENYNGYQNSDWDSDASDTSEPFDSDCESEISDELQNSAGDLEDPILSVPMQFEGKGEVLDEAPVQVVYVELITKSAPMQFEGKEEVLDGAPAQAVHLEVIERSPPKQLEGKEEVLDRALAQAAHLKEIDKSVPMQLEGKEEVLDKALAQAVHLKEIDKKSRKNKKVPREHYNWAKNQQYVPIEEYQPRNLQEVKDALQKAYAAGHHVTVIGATYGWSNLGSTRGVVINTKNLTKVELNYVEGEVVTATVQSGAPIAKLIKRLAEANKILPNSPIFAKMSMGGGLAVGIHGTGRDFHPLPDYIIDVTVVNINREGMVEVATYNKKDHPDTMKALNVNLGAMGFVYSMTVQVHERFNIKAVDKHVPWPATKDDFIKFLKKLVLKNDYVELFWWPTTTKLWVKKWNRTDEPATADFVLKLKNIVQSIEIKAGYPIVQLLGAFPKWTPKIMALMMEMSLPCGRAEVIAPANFIYNYLSAVPPKQWDMNHCLNIKKVGTEYDFSSVAESYMKIYDMVQKESARGRYPLNTTLHTRFISNSEAYMSPNNGNDYSAMTEILAWNVTTDWVPFFKKVEQTWLDMNGRPHWGKCIFQLPNRSVWGGGSGLEKFLKVKEQLDPHNVFLNDFQYDIFKRIIPKMMTVKIEKITMHESLFPRIIHSFKSCFHKEWHNYQIKIVTASDAHVTKEVRSKSFHDIVVDQTFHNVTFSNFIEFQLWVDNHIASTAVWHAPLYKYSEGETIAQTIHFQPNWDSHTDRGCINLALTPINTSSTIQPRDIVESVAIVGTLENDFPDDAQASSSVQAEFAELSAKAGLKVFVNSELSSIAADCGEEFQINVGECVADAVKAANIIVFACTPSKAQEYVHKCGSLAHKIVVDATQYFGGGADVVTPVDYGKDVSVAKIEEVYDGGVHVNIYATNTGVQQVASAWIRSMGLAPRVIAQ